MNIIGKSSHHVKILTDRARDLFYVTVDEDAGQIFFNTPVVLFCEMKKDLSVFFMNDGDDWRFYLTDDPDAFKLVPYNRKGQNRKSLRICNKGLSRMILKSFGFHHSKRFTVEKTPNFIDRNPVYKLSLERVSTVG